MKTLDLTAIQWHVTADSKPQLIKYKSLLHRLALITGASGGIGAAAARKIASMGADICLQANSNPTAAEKLAHELKKIYPLQTFTVITIDLAKPEAGSTLIKLCQDIAGNPDIFVSCAGTANIAPLNDLTEETYCKLQYLHLQTPLFACQAMIPHLLQHKWGRIVMVSSIWGITGASCEVAYSALKAGEIGLTKALAKEWGPSGITVNAVAPGVIDTAMNSSLETATRLELIEQTPVGRLGTPADVATAIAFLVGREAGFVTGQVLSPNGGFLI